MTPADELRAAAAHIRQLAEAATPGPWYYDSYSWIASGPLMQPYEKWDTGNHSCERYGTCPECGEWKKSPYAPSPGLGHGCKLHDEEYRREPTVARVPAHHGDTAIDAHRWDADHISTWHPGVALLVADWLEAKAIEYETRCTTVAQQRFVAGEYGGDPDPAVALARALHPTKDGDND
jgi:hypothetical protein